MDEPKWMAYLTKQERAALEKAEKATAARDELRKRLKHRCEARQRAERKRDD